MASRDTNTPVPDDAASVKTSAREHRPKTSWLVAAVLLAIVIRVGLIATNPDQLLDDRDAYLALSTEIVEGRGLVSTGDGKPTAFRPPLVPVVLAFLRCLLDDRWSVLVLNLSATVIVVVCVVSIARQTGVRRPETAGILVAFDPTLTAYSALPMTEVPSAALLAMLFAIRFCRKSSSTSQLLCGITSGLLLLCRPSFWPAIVMLCLLWSRGQSTGETGPVPVRRMVGSAATMIAGLLLLIVPWTVRNLIQLDAAIFTTTHGGYTLHLGNNANFYANVAARNWHTVWPEREFRAWETENRQELIASGDEETEVSEDRWHYDTACSWIESHPGEFIQCCCVRVCRFWALRPLKLPASLDHLMITSAISLWYLLILAGGLAGCWIARRRCSQLVISVAIVAFSLTAVHTVYWSNMRFRAPLNPLLMILLCCAADTLFRNRQTETVS